jgi:Plasmid encoded RepA protein
MSGRGSKDGFQQLGEIPLFKELQAKVKPPTPIQRRIMEAAAFAVENPDSPQEILYQHSALCQTFLPYRDPGDDARTWERNNGTVHLDIAAGKAMHPVKNRLVPVGLPFGAKARLVLMHINQLALRSGSPEIEVENTFTRFVSHGLGLTSKGRTIRTVKDQLARLATSRITIGTVKNGEALTTQGQIVTAFNIWFPKNENQRVFWPSTLHLSLDYFVGLQTHAVPLDQQHIAALAHSPMALDIYAWLAQRLHRIPTGKPVALSWPVLFLQFGQSYSGKNATKNFRQDFRKALKQVLNVYREARIDDAPAKAARLTFKSGDTLPDWTSPPAEGLTLHHSPPPVKPRLIAITGGK